MSGARWAWASAGVLATGLTVGATAAPPTGAAQPVAPTPSRAAGGGSAGPRPAVTRPATTRPAATQAAPFPSSERIMEEMSQEIEANPLVEPSHRPGGAAPPRRQVGIPSTPPLGVAGGTLDPAVVGVAPGAKPPKLRREGEFVVNRIGRIVRPGNASQAVLVFDADSKEAPEPPVVLLPSTALQNMEDQVQERGDRVRFEVSGQITTYRGANYLMITRWALPPDKGNLQR